MPSHHLIIFFISFFCIALELFFTRILNLKAWNHLVYIIIPFAILGYGIGANFYLVVKKKVSQVKVESLLAWGLVVLSVATTVCTVLLIHRPIELTALLNFLFLKNLASLQTLIIAYTLVLIPFIPIGFIISFLFSLDYTRNHRLYFFDLIGAGSGAVAFFFLINHLAVYHSILLLCLGGLLFALLLVIKQRRALTITVFVLLSMAGFIFSDEPANYKIDPNKGWEWFPGYYQQTQFETVVSQWHPLGRTEIYRLTDPVARQELYETGLGTFQINLHPIPEFSYISTNGLAGTPVYKMHPLGLAEHGSQVQLFSQAMEVPYTILKQPRVVVIGAGGGRDIFMANTHGAKSIVGAEINPAIHQQMSKGGAMYEYSGRIYEQDQTKILNIDGRHLAKTLPSRSYDLIILNGVDTFSGLSSGAYAYAESYLYTKNAVMDYLRLLDDGGMINFNRWFFPEIPREDLRLLAICLESLRASGVKSPWDHIIMGAYGSWAIFLVKKTPFTPQERETIEQYFRQHQTQLLFPTEVFKNHSMNGINLYELYAVDFTEGHEKGFARLYPYDISVNTDDDPFFYKYYKLNLAHPFLLEIAHHTGTIIFITQIVIFWQTLFFILLFILLPLLIFKLSGVRRLPKGSFAPFVIYYACLGLGFMFIEIPLMQKFVLLLGTPIHSITVVLSALLIFTGLGSYLLGWYNGLSQNKGQLMMLLGLVLTGLLLLFIKFGSPFLDHFMSWPFAGRVLMVSLCLFPFGLCLGIFFPAGLLLTGKYLPETIAWAWGINCGFSVLGSLLAIFLAQFLGFNSVLSLALIIYLMAALSFGRMEKFFNP